MKHLTKWSRFGATPCLTENPMVLEKVENSGELLMKLLRDGHWIYGKLKTFSMSLSNRTQLMRHL